jgi:hypothetical protein
MEQTADHAQQVSVAVAGAGKRGNAMLIRQIDDMIEDLLRTQPTDAIERHRHRRGPLSLALAVRALLK